MGWARTEKALRNARVLPGPSASAIITVGVLIGTALIGIGLLT